MKRHIISALVTFVTGFAIVILPQLDNLDVDNLSNAVLWGLVFTGLRGGIKALLELLISSRR